MRDGFDPALDELRTISRSGKQVIAQMEEQERARTGIPSLKVRYNRVFGYYIEVSKSNLHAVPADYLRKQTIAGGERYITPALKEYEEKVLGADERILEREIEVFERLRSEVAALSPRIQDTARALAALDALAALAETATINNYTKPHVHEGDEAQMLDGRHPVVERHSSEAFVPNDTQSQRDDAPAGHPDRTQHGRQVDLPAPGGHHLASSRRQVRSSRPARPSWRSWTGSSRGSARPTTSRAASPRSWSRCRRRRTSCIRRRRGAWSSSTRSAAARRRSTASASPGRWPSTSPPTRRSRPKTIFATHYHELTDLADGIAGVVNYHVDAREWHDDIIFLRKVVAGRSDRSYGIQVARLAGLPRPVVERAQEILGALEHDELARGGRPSMSHTATEPQQQLGLFQAPAVGRRTARRATAGGGPGPHDAARCALAARRVEAGSHGAMRPLATAACTLVLAGCAVLAAGCTKPVDIPPGFITVALVSSPNNLDPRVGTDEVSQRVHQLIFDPLFAIDHQLRVVPWLADGWEMPDSRTYLVRLRHGVPFHDGRELTSADVVYTFSTLIDPAFLSPRKGAYRMVEAVRARDRYTVEFRLKEPFGSFPVNLVMGIVPAGWNGKTPPVGTGPYRFVSAAADERVVLAAFPGYYRGAPKNAGVLLRVIPDDVMRGLELRRGSVDLLVNDLAPDIVHQLASEGRLQVVKSEGTDYAYLGFNLRDPVLADRRVRQAIGFAIDRASIITYLRRGLAIPALGVLPPASWAFNPDVFSFRYDPARAGALLDEAGYPATGPGGVRIRLSLKVSSSEFNRLQSAVIQQDLRQVGIDSRRPDLRVRYPVRGRAEGQLPDVHAAVGGRVGPGHAAPRLPLEAGAADRFQSRLLPERRGGPADRRRHRVGR